MEYKEFLKTKEHSQYMNGIDVDWMPEAMFDFQKYVTDYASKKGRAAIKQIITLTILRVALIPKT